jgi:GNAT superfamily N-acetyltransferase
MDIHSAKGFPAINPAKPEEVGIALSILMEASTWLSSKGIDQWPMEWIVSPNLRAWMAERSRQGELYFAETERAKVGLFSLVKVQLEGDVLLWGVDGGRSAYLHSFAVRRAWAGRGLGREMLAYSEKLAAKAGKKTMRLDCGRENPRLRKWYEDAGFVLKGEGLPPYTGGRVLSLYEKQL